MVRATFVCLLMAFLVEAHRLPRRPSLENEIIKENECGLKRGVMKIYVPGCNPRIIRSVGCKGFCLSSAKPGVSEKSKTINEFFRVCSCCQPKTWRSRNIKLICPMLTTKVRRVKVYVATRCSCLPCGNSSRTIKKKD